MAEYKEETGDNVEICLNGDLREKAWAENKRARAENGEVYVTLDGGNGGRKRDFVILRVVSKEKVLLLVLLCCFWRWKSTKSGVVKLRV
ncbi:hypothetical protein LIER_02662 [Lithospermum erythrorhizon]|uniref:Uncharacterized protein n=1 Tax=Lithospermum erythrorhizon TaxID=34254 RepID=A0AAV3NQB3_LITER